MNTRNDHEDNSITKTVFIQEASDLLGFSIGEAEKKI
jgi:hypothetical protein